MLNYAHSASVRQRQIKSQRDDRSDSLPSFLHSDQVLHPIIWRPVLLGLPKDERVPHCPDRHGVQSVRGEWPAALRRPAKEEGLHLPGSGQQQGGAQVSAD